MFLVSFHPNFDFSPYFCISSQLDKILCNVNFVEYGNIPYELHDQVRKKTKNKNRILSKKAILTLSNDQRYYFKSLQLCIEYNLIII
jgi:hypothetical protein